MNQRALLALTALLLGLLQPLPQAWVEARGDTITVVVTFSSLASEVQALLKDTGCNATLYTMVRGEVDPHSYTLSPGDIQALKRADLIVSTEHTPFEQRISELLNQGILDAAYLSTRDAVTLLRLPQTGTPNLHFPIYHPENYRAFLEKLADKLASICPREAGRIYANLYTMEAELDTLLEKAARIEAQSGGREAIVASPPGQYALEGLGIRVVHVIVPEPEAGAGASQLNRALELLGQHGILAGVLEAPPRMGSRIPASPADEWLYAKSLERGAPVVWVPHPLSEATVLEKLSYIVSQLEQEASPKQGVEANAGEGMVIGRLMTLLLAGALIILVMAIAGGFWRHWTPTLLPSYVGGSLAASGVLAYLTCNVSPSCGLAWIAVMVGAGLSLGGLSALVGVRRLFFLAAAVPHTALFSVSLGLLLENTVGGGFRLWGLLANSLLLLVAWGLMQRVEQQADRVVALLVGGTSSASVLLLYYLTTRQGAGYSVASLVLGDPLLADEASSLLALAVGLAVAVYSITTFREHVMIGANRLTALLAGIRAGLYDVSLLLVLSIATVVLLDIVGSILAHILLLLPGSAALTAARRAAEILPLSLTLALTSSLLGLSASLETSLSPVGLLGMVLLLQFGFLALLSRREGG